MKSFEASLNGYSKAEIPRTAVRWLAVVADRYRSFSGKVSLGAESRPLVPVR